MRILLPPSEGKTTPQKGSPLNLSVLHFADELTGSRVALLDALTRLCTETPELARQTLGLTENQMAEVVRNQSLLTAPTAPAWQVYTGVLYSELDAATLTPKQRQKLSDSVWIASALFGLVGFDDSIPAYRLSGDTALPGIGALASFWRDHLTSLLEREPGLILDLRSGSYVKLGPLSPKLAERTIVPRVLQKRPAGPPKLITHFNKATKGRLVRAIAQSRGTLESVSQLAKLITAQGMEVEVRPSTRPGTPIPVDIFCV